MTSTIQNIEAIADQYDAFILDIFGVLHDGITPFPDTKRTLEAMKAAGKKVCLLSNSPRRADNAAAQMEGMGLPRDLYDNIVTSGESTHDALADGIDPFHRECGRNCWFIGNAYVAEVVEGLELNLLESPQGASFILNTIPGTEARQITALEENLQIAAARDMPMICANPDLIVHIGETLYECAGTFALRYEEMGGRVVYHGKPYAPVYERCFELLGAPEKSRICAVGDSLRTDIAGADNFGIDSILNLAGIHREEITSDKLDHLENQPHKPTYLIDGFCW